MTATLAAHFRKNKIDLREKKFYAVSYAQVTSSAKLSVNISENEQVNARSNDFQKKFDVIQKIEEIIEKYQANVFEISDIETLKKVFLGYHAAYFSCAKLPLSPETMQHSSKELQSAVILRKQVFTLHFPSKR